jgi:hypothetical protein
LFTVSVKIQARAGEGYSLAMKQGKNSLHDRQRLPLRATPPSIHEFDPGTT